MACYAFSIQPNYPQIWKFKHQEKENEDLGKEEHFIFIYIWSHKQIDKFINTKGSQPPAKNR